MEIDEIEQKAVEYLRTKFGAKSITVRGVGTAQVGSEVEGSLEDKDGVKHSFKVNVGLDGKILSWKLEPIIMPKARFK